VEAVVFFTAGVSFQALNIGFSDMTGIALCFLIPVATWCFIKPYLLKAEHLKPLNQQLKKFKYNSALFNQLLSSQTKYSVPDDLMPRPVTTIVALVHSRNIIVLNNKSTHYGNKLFP
jgi:hypothetical protein